jgi:PKD repeat protein
MVDMFFGPYQDTQALYVVKFGNHDTVIRIRYTGIHNDPPLVQFDFEDKSYDVGDEIQFDGSLSKDPEGDKITFKWFFGDGEKSTKETPTHSYNETGAYKVTLIVGDSLNQLQEMSRMLQVGTPPIVNILSPAEGDQFFVGQVLRLKGEASYANGTSVMDSNLEWEIRKHHSDHFHPFLDSTFGNNFDVYAAPKPEDFYASLNTYLEINLRVTDEIGLVGETSRIMQPTLVMVDVKSNIPGVEILVEDEPITLPGEVWGWGEQEISLKADNNPPFMFQSWSDGVRDPIRVVTLNFSEPVFEAIFCVDDGGNCSADGQTCCIGECNVEGICSVPVKLPPLYLDTTPPPTEVRMSSPSMGIPGTSAPTPTQSTNYFNIQFNGSNELHHSSSISSAGKAMLSITCLLIVAIISSFLFLWKYRQRIETISPPSTEKDPPNEEIGAYLEECIEDEPAHSETGSSSDDATTAALINYNFKEPI